LTIKVQTSGTFMKTNIRGVLLADSRSQVRWALRTVIREEPGLTVVGEASEAGSLLAQAWALRPDLILVEWELPGRSGPALLSDLRELGFACCVIVLGQQMESQQAALAAGADAFLSKTAAPQQVLAMLHTLADR
jgi:DNA-binding NarL/FixJ family response regulator